LNGISATAPISFSFGTGTVRVAPHAVIDPLALAKFVEKVTINPLLSLCDIQERERESVPLGLPKFHYLRSLTATFATMAKRGKYEFGGP
jgi:hypothetical protein